MKKLFNLSPTLKTIEINTKNTRSLLILGSKHILGETQVE